MRCYMCGFHFEWNQAERVITPKRPTKREEVQQPELEVEPEPEPEPEQRTEAAASELRLCDAHLSIRGEPLDFGPQDMAVGVRADLIDVQQALSYWIQTLRSCNPRVPGQPRRYDYPHPNTLIP